MFAALFLKLTKYAWFRRLIWKPIYNWLARDFKADKWYFMNYGYVPKPDEEPLHLHEEDEINRYQIQLYHYLAIKTDIEGKDVLEVGSGRGGGARYIAAYLNPKFMTGMDLAPSATRLSNELHKAANLNYINGNAEAIPVGDDHLDVVVNVESCHAYGSVPRFLAEVKRVLRPGGRLVLTDLRSPGGMQLLEQHLQNCGMDLLFEDEISKEVVKAIELEEDIKRNRIRQAIPKWLHEAFAEFGGAVGSQIHLQLKSGDLVYKRFMLQKKV
ncbi:MAG: class I SAM-dependent methyltransferase [Flavobacteriales bacterium]|nr:class I SAM-dependent methyltransferase [Flavobacteriales bacterium]